MKQESRFDNQNTFYVLGFCVFSSNLIVTSHIIQVYDQATKQLINMIQNFEVPILWQRDIIPIPSPYVETNECISFVSTGILYTTYAIAKVYYSVDLQTGRIVPNRQPILPYVIRQELRPSQTKTLEHRPSGSHSLSELTLSSNPAVTVKTKTLPKTKERSCRIFGNESTPVNVSNSIILSLLRETSDT